jgi:hypothetical protein
MRLALARSLCAIARLKKEEKAGGSRAIRRILPEEKQTRGFGVTSW